MKTNAMIIAIFIVTATVIAMAIVVGIKEKETGNEKYPNKAEVTDLLHREPIEENEMKLTSEHKVAFENAEWIIVEKVARTIVEDEEGNSETTYQTYVVSDVDLKEKKDDTSEYALSLASDGLDDSLVKEIAFCDGFGFSYEGMNASQIFDKLLEVNGFDGDLYKASFDKKTYESTKQNLFILDEKSKVLESMLEGITYDELLESKVSYQTIKLKSGVVVPDCITAVVQYKEANKIYTKSIFLQVTINEWEEGVDEMV